MSDVLLKTVFFVILIYVLEVSALLDFKPENFARERYERSRNKTISRSLLPGVHQAIDFVALVNRYGYPGEEHRITTIDGYILRIHRIPGSPSRPKGGRKPVIFLQHGLFGSSDMWVLMGPERDFAYMLADIGYDVWLGNARGNTYSRAHVKLSPNYDPEFWQFSFHEIAVFDITAVIDYILQKTNQPSLSYVGHSMGTTISYVLLSTRPEYNKKIDLVISLAPVALWHAHPRPFVKFLMDNTDAIKNFVVNARIHEIFPLTSANAQLAQATCSDGSILQQLCLNVIFLISGFNPSQLNATVVPYFLSYFPAGASAKTLIHYSQNMHSGDFKMYDYRLIQNFAIYNQQDPPSYNLSNIIAPVVLVYGKGDALVVPENPLQLAKILPNVITVETVRDKRFSHFDFLFSQDIKTLLNDRLLEVVKRASRHKRLL